MKEQNGGSNVVSAKDKPPKDSKSKDRPKPATKTKEPKEPKELKRPPSAYNLFLKNLQEQTGLPMGELSRVGAESWKALEPELRQKFEDEAAALKCAAEGDATGCKGAAKVPTAFNLFQQSKQEELQGHTFGERQRLIGGSLARTISFD